MSPTPPAPLLVIAVGNPSRGDDALGPALLDALRETGAALEGEVELLELFQLQVEHALDLQGRRAVLFVDAALQEALQEARPDARAEERREGAALWAIEAAPERVPASHALRPQAVLAVLEQAFGLPPPPAWQLAISATSFGLGEGLSPAAQAHLAQARALALQWLSARRGASPAPAPAAR